MVATLLALGLRSLAFHPRNFHPLKVDLKEVDFELFQKLLELHEEGQIRVRGFTLATIKDFASPGRRSRDISLDFNLKSTTDHEKLVQILQPYLSSFILVLEWHEKLYTVNGLVMTELFVSSFSLESVGSNGLKVTGPKIDENTDKFICLHCLRHDY